MRSLFFRRGQNLVDLALIIGVVGLVIISMEVYIRRGVQGKVKDMADYAISGSQSATQSEDQVEQTTKTTFSADSNLTLSEFKAGGKELKGTENSFTEYVTGDYKEPKSSGE
ncbi:MAG TPA: hypothetical protein PL125_07235 [Candidatus Omnitrophota bacterium]|nr:hypothetical protein [Candidatus Omnitrophota bacterium]HPT39967.1 hypothetical protein [Candidatus Omnitrophota bacterium]